jgi:AcrR family transcriptional regulator
MVLTMVALPKRDRLTERREATRQEILAAAWEVAREAGLAGLTLREVAARIGMQAPSLYSHFASKNAIYDAMFEQAWRQFLAQAVWVTRSAPEEPREEPRARLAAIAANYFDFAVADLPRHQIMDVRAIPGFTPSTDAYAAAVECFGGMRRELLTIGITEDADVDLYTALIGGLIEQQLANDPGGDRWRRQLPRVIGMFADEAGLPPAPPGRTRRTS